MALVSLTLPTPSISLRKNLQSLFVLLDRQLACESSECVEGERLHFSLAGHYYYGSEESHLLLYFLHALLAVGYAAGEDNGVGLAPECHCHCADLLGDGVEHGFEHFMIRLFAEFGAA